MKQLIATLFIFYTMMLNPVAGVVLCLGENGHVAVEVSSQDNHRCETQEEQFAHTLCLQDSCWDIPLSIQSEQDVLIPNKLDFTHLLVTDDAQTVYHDLRTVADVGSRPFSWSENRPVRAIVSHIQTIQLII